MSAKEGARVALIPARGGSKRIPGKNTRLFASKPLITHSIEAALASGCFERVIVSTDSEAIAQIAREHGAEVPFMRPAELANDFATTDQVVKHALSWLTAHERAPDYICCIYPTAPMLRAQDLRDGFIKLQDTGATTVLSVTTFAFPIQRALRSNERERLLMNEPEHRLTRSQDLEEMWHDAGQFYWLRAAEYLRSEGIYNADMLGLCVPRHLVQDIDTPEDWRRAELLWKVLQLESSGEGGSSRSLG